MKKLFLLVIILASASGASAGWFDWLGWFKKSTVGNVSRQNFSNDNTLKVALEKGNIAVENSGVIGSRNQMIALFHAANEIDKKRLRDNTSTVVDQDGRVRRVVSKIPSNCEDCSVDIKMLLDVRLDNMSIDVSTESGNIFVDNMAGNITAKTKKGSIDIANSTGDSVLVGTDNGNISLNSIHNNRVEAYTNGGNISADKLFGINANLMTLRGDIFVTRALAQLTALAHVGNIKAHCYNSHELNAPKGKVYLTKGDLFKDGHFCLTEFNRSRIDRSLCKEGTSHYLY